MSARDLAASYRVRPGDTFTREALLAARGTPAPARSPSTSSTLLPIGRYSQRNATADRHQHRPHAIEYPGGTVYVCRCGWRDARARPAALVAALAG